MRAGGSRRRRATAALLGAAAVLGVVAFAHTRAARPLLGWLGLGSGCPMSLAGQTPASLEQRRVETMRPLAGTEPAHARPALGFVLGRTTRAEVSTWAMAHSVPCTDTLLDTALRCRDVGAAAAMEPEGIPIADAYFRFDPGGTLVAVDVMHQGTNGAAAARFLDGASARLSRDVGAPSHVDIEPEPALATLYGQSSVEYRFRDYAADVSATNFGEVGVVVREQYRAID
jgi:hypothetical protein